MVKTGFLTIKSAVLQGTALLDDARVAAPRLTAEVLLCCALKCERSYLYSHSGDELSELAWIHFGRYLHQRLQGVPTQYITRNQEFYGRDFYVSPAVLIPRPETEHLVSAALDVLNQQSNRAARAIDVGCGSGAIGITLSLESRTTQVFATDVSLTALEVAVRNAATLGASVSFCAGNLLTMFGSSTLDVVVSNPPYVSWAEKEGMQREVVEHEPHLALFGGPNGDETYRELIEQAHEVLVPGGWLLLELGWKSLPAVQAMLGSAWTQTETIPDLSGIPRVLQTRRA